MKFNVNDLTLEEKLKLLTGKTSWQTNDLDGKIPSLFLADGPNGLRKMEIKSIETEENGIITSKTTFPATAMPNTVVVANTWNPEMAYLNGATIADDCIDKDVDVLLAPGVNMKRNALNGRNFEYFSEDPYLAGKMGRAFVEGVQNKGIGTSLKHFIANNGEFDRLGMSNELDERTMREIYLPAFEEVLKAKPWTVMCAYNPVNGVYASANKKLLKKLLRDEFGFDGLIVSDWGAVHDHAKAIKATLDLRMPHNLKALEQLKTALDSGEITEEDVDARVQKILDLIEKKLNADKTKKVTTTKQQRHENAVKIAKEGIVLLKNEDNILPLKNIKKLSVVGKFNAQPALGGGGSAYVKTEYQIEPLSELLARKLGVEVYAGAVTGTDLVLSSNFIRQNLEQIYSSDVAILCVGEQAPVVGEGHDRESMKLTAVQENLIINASKYNENLVVVLHGGSAIDMSAWIDKVKAVVFAGFSGEGANEALCSILTGETAPSGKLNETFPLCLEDTVTKGNLSDGQVEWYKEGLFIGYRHYDKNKLDVLYPFGHGLSYAKFEYSNLKVEKQGDYDYVVSYDIKNLSEIDAKEISQVYVKDVFSSVVRPIRELKGFSKDFIKAGETKRIKIDLDYRSFAYYSTVFDEWTVESGAFIIEVGASSRDIKLSQEIIIK